ncbi:MULTISPECIES: hypothetical protein [unclassified Bradyrhizobium]|uniref:hypothetical protein n=1 Tax=unclassified Bradyrhizobium TaxID=2631580 RepID=UPI002011E554|nr:MULTISPECIES: hypothetical protein [unclassified Bradyrhizobium]
MKVPEVNRKRSGLRLLAGVGVIVASVTLEAGISHAQQLAAQTDQAPLQQDKPLKPSSRSVMAAAAAGPSASASGADVKPVRRSMAKGPYYVDFRARTAASYGHAFVWYGKSSQKQVEVAGLHPAGDVLPYVLGHLTWVPSETGASYGDLDEQYLTASYRVYLSEADAKKVFAYIKELQASSPVWNAETTNCTAFIGRIANFMGLKAPFHLLKPEEYVNQLRDMNGGRQTVQLASDR